MPRGNSGRVVIEVGPEKKRELYAALDLSGVTLKDWFLKHANAFCTEAIQPSFNFTQPTVAKGKDLISEGSRPSRSQKQGQQQKKT